MYKLYAEAMNEHSAFKVPAYQSNLCLSGDTIIKTENGDIKLKDIKIGEKVLSYNTDTGKKEYKTVTDFALMNPKTKVMKITDENTGKSIICTPDHKVFTKNRGYIEAKDLQENDVLEIL